MKKLIAIAFLSLGLSGCGKQYMMYAEAQKAIATENAKAYAAAETARYNALAQIAKDGDATSRVAAAMSLSLGGGGGSRAPQPPNIVAPKSAGETALQWTSTVLPVAATIYGIAANRDVAIKQSDNDRARFENTNAAMLGMSNNQAATAASGFTAINGVASAGFKSVSDTATAGFNSNQNIANAGFKSVSDTATAGFTSNQNIANAGFTAVTKIAETAKPNITITSGPGSSINAGNSGTSSSGSIAYEYNELQTIQTLAGNGVIGSGAYTFADNTNNSTNGSYNPNNAVDNRVDNSDNSTNTTTTTTTNNTSPP